jgi:hypothetical protein
MVLDEQTAGITRNHQFEDKDNRVDNKQHHGQRHVSSVFRLAHVITIFKHNQGKLVAKPLFFNGLLRHAPPPEHPFASGVVGMGTGNRVFAAHGEKG